jgi:hypothetical protein
MMTVTAVDGTVLERKTGMEGDAIALRDLSDAVMTAAAAEIDTVVQAMTTGPAVETMTKVVVETGIDDDVMMEAIVEKGIAVVEIAVAGHQDDDMMMIGGRLSIIANVYKSF